MIMYWYLFGYAAGLLFVRVLGLIDMAITTDP